MLTAPATINTSNDNNSAARNPLPTPPLTHASLPPLKLRLRSRQPDADGNVATRKRVAKRAAPPPRGIHKRRRGTDDDMGRDDDIDSDLDIEDSIGQDGNDDTEYGHAGPRTPKRARIAPESIPLGLERSDFHNLNSGAEDQSRVEEGTEVEVEADGENWSTEDDRILVELVLEKLKLSKTDWQDCARSLGRDRSSIGRRWKSLMINGDVGLRTRSRRSKIHGTWR
jgi:hypothetical protein